MKVNTNHLTFNLHDLPSATTTVLATIIITVLSHFVGVNVGGYVLLIIIVIIVFVWFYGHPTRWIRKYKMQEMEIDYPDVTRKITDFVHNIGFPLPKLYITNRKGFYIQSFGTFKRSFIVMNRIEVETIKRLNAKELGAGDNFLYAIIAHEIGHIRSGDVWKFQLSRAIVQIVFFYSLLQLLLIGASQYSMTRLFLSFPADSAAFILDMLFFVIFMGVLFYMVREIRQVREFYADDLAKQVLGCDYLMDAMAVVSSISHSPDNKRESPGMPFLSDVSFARERLNALDQGIHFHSVLREVLFACGLAVGIQVHSLDNVGLTLLSAGFLLGGLVASIFYLLPYLYIENQQDNPIIFQPIVAAGSFLAGVLLMMIVRITVDSVVFWAVGSYLDTLTGYILAQIELTVMLFVKGLELCLALYMILPVMKRIKAKTTTGQFAGHWKFSFFWPMIAQGIFVLFLLDALATQLLSFVFPPSQLFTTDLRIFLFIFIPLYLLFLLLFVFSGPNLMISAIAVGMTVLGVYVDFTSSSLKSILFSRPQTLKTLGFDTGPVNPSELGFSMDDLEIASLDLLRCKSVNGQGGDDFIAFMQIANTNKSNWVQASGFVYFYDDQQNLVGSFPFQNLGIGANSARELVPASLLEKSIPFSIKGEHYYRPALVYNQIRLGKPDSHRDEARADLNLIPHTQRDGSRTGHIFDIEVKNLGSISLYQVRVFGVVYDLDGKLIDISWSEVPGTLTSGEHLKPGGTVQLTLKSISKTGRCLENSDQYRVHFWLDSLLPSGYPFVFDKRFENP